VPGRVNPTDLPKGPYDVLPGSSHELCPLFAELGSKIGHNRLDLPGSVGSLVVSQKGPDRLRSDTSPCCWGRWSRYKTASGKEEADRRLPWTCPLREFRYLSHGEHFLCSRSSVGRRHWAGESLGRFDSQKAVLSGLANTGDPLVSCPIRDRCLGLRWKSESLNGV
jgi:hypothetical protein